MAVKFAKTNSTLIQQASELPDIAFEDVYLDFETSSGDPKHDSLNPWGPHCRVIGAAITGDDWPESVFVPREILVTARDWFWQLLRSARVFINANAKYDLHVLLNDPDLKFLWQKEVRDVTMIAKIIDSDRTYKGGYGLDALALAFCDLNLKPWYDRLKPYTHRVNGDVYNRDYGRVPLDILADYACAQIQATREVYRYCIREMPPECRELLEKEVRCTSTLLNIERRGLMINLQEVQQKHLISTYKMMKYGERLKEILGYDINPRSPVDVHDTLISRYGLPVVAWTNEDDDEKKSNPSFDKDAMVMYASLPEVRANPAIKEVVALINDYRYEAIHTSLFWEKWQKLATPMGDGYALLHSDYNQTVRSGRMSCSEPNAQQLDWAAEDCIHPRKGMAFILKDYSQVEFRLIVHYIENPAATKAYNENPDTDFHKWVADMCGVTRKLGKTLDLALGFDMGKKSTIAHLLACEDLADADITPFEKRRRAVALYDTFHLYLPEQKPCSRKAAAVAARRGFVFNSHKRRLHLPRDRAHIAFNRIIQSEAADLMKDAAVDLEEFTRGHDCHLDALVHDSALTEVPVEEAEQWAPKLKAVMENTRVKYRVPIRVTIKGISAKSWGDADK